MYSTAGQDKPTLNKAYVLSKVNSLSIFRSYVYPDLEPYSGFICPDWVRSSLNRKLDNRNSASVYLSSTGEYIFKDWGSGFKGDVFELIKLKYNCNYNEALIRVANDFGLDYFGKKDNQLAIFKCEERAEVKKEYCEIRFKPRRFDYMDRLFWLSFGIPLDFLSSLKIYAVEAVWLNGELNYIYRPHDAAYAYDFGNGKVKIYYPHRKEYRFLTNTASSNFLEGFDTLPRFGKELIITKSYKDVAFIRSLNIPSVSTSSETVLINNKLMEEIQSRFAITYILFDNDDQGVKMSNTYVQEYPFLNQIFIPKSIAKDITDVSKKRNRQFAEKTLKELLIY